MKKPPIGRMSGKKLQDAAVALARIKGYRVAHFNPATVRPGRTVTSYSYDSKGFPDLLLVGRKVVAVEVKGSGDTIRSDQTAWLSAFEDAGVETMILTPRRWRDGDLERLLDS